MTISLPSKADPRLLELAAEQCRDGATRLAAADAAALAACLPGWAIVNGSLHREFAFADFDETMAFVNAIAFVARSQNHHPELSVHYARCAVTFSTHDVGGLTRNDFICAARTERLFA